MKIKMETYFRSIKLPMTVEETDITDFKLESSIFTPAFVKETVIKAFA